MNPSKDQLRLEKILERLETRSEQCPGMFPVTTQEHWRQLALHHHPAAAQSTQLLWQTLESFDRNPQLAHQALNNLLAQRAPTQLWSVGADPKATARERLAIIDSVLSPATPDYKSRHG